MITVSDAQELKQWDDDDDDDDSDKLQFWSFGPLTSQNLRKYWKTVAAMNTQYTMEYKRKSRKNL